MFWPNISKSETIAERDYKQLSQKIIEREWSEKAPTDINFNRLRVMYAQTTLYDPKGEDTRALLTQIAEQIHSATTDEQRQNLASIYQEIMRDQIANFSAASYTWSLAKNDIIFGNYRFWNAIRSALFYAIINSGDGKSKETAYTIVTLDEETMLLKFLGYELLSTFTLELGALVYNIHSVHDPKTGAHLELFVNATLPLKHLKEKAGQERKTINIPKR